MLGKRPSPLKPFCSDSTHLVVRPDAPGTTPARWLVKALARSITWYDGLVSGRAASFREIALREGVAERYIAQLLPLAFLDPKLSGSVSMVAERSH